MTELDDTTRIIAALLTIAVLAGSEREPTEDYPEEAEQAVHQYQAILNELMKA
jgi:hypothetical protein